MIQDWLAARHPAIYPVTAMMIFLLIFVAVLLHNFVGRERRRSEKRLASLPLDDEGDSAGPLDAERGRVSQS